MLVAIAKSVGRKAVPVKSAQIKKRGYSSVLRAVNEEVAALDTTVLKKVLANKEGYNTLAQAYKDASAAQIAARDEIVASVQKELGNSPFASVRSAADAFVTSLNHLNSDVDVDVAKFSLPLQNIDEVLEVHEVSVLANAYAKAFAQLPYVPTKTSVPVDAVSSSFAGAVRFSFALSVLPPPPYSDSQTLTRQWRSIAHFSPI